MATTSPDNLKTPDAGDQYALVQDLGALADTVQNALKRRANLMLGTVAERNAFTASAPQGIHWQDTDGTNLFEWVMRNGTWDRADKPSSVSGTGTLSMPVGSSTANVTFPAGSFTTAPRVLINFGGPLSNARFIDYRATGVSTAGFTVDGYNSGTSTVSSTYVWIASA